MVNEVRYLTIGSNTYSVGGSGGGSASGLLVTINITTNGNTVIYTADKTAQEIYDAVSNGITPMIYLDNHYYPAAVHLFTNGLSISGQDLGYWLKTSSMSAYPTYTKSGGGSDD